MYTYAVGYVIEGLTEDVESSIIKEILTCVMVNMCVTFCLTSLCLRN